MNPGNGSSIFLIMEVVDYFGKQIAALFAIWILFSREQIVCIFLPCQFSSYVLP